MQHQPPPDERDQDPVLRGEQLEHKAVVGRKRSGRGAAELGPDLVVWAAESAQCASVYCTSPSTGWGANMCWVPTCVWCWRWLVVVLVGAVLLLLLRRRLTAAAVVVIVLHSNKPLLKISR